MEFSEYLQLDGMAHLPSFLRHPVYIDLLVVMLFVSLVIFLIIKSNAVTKFCFFSCMSLCKACTVVYCLSIA